MRDGYRIRLTKGRWWWRAEVQPGDPLGEFEPPPQFARPTRDGALRAARRWCDHASRCGTSLLDGEWVHYDPPPRRDTGGDL